MGISNLILKWKFFSYRCSTICKSFKALYTLPKDKVDAFVNSYSIYDYDWAKEEEMKRSLGPNYYQIAQQKVEDCYSVLNLLLPLGQVEKMYLPPVLDLSASIITNQELFEKKMASDLNIVKESKVLDLGCGRGRVAAYIHSVTGAEMTGINLDQVQIKYAQEYAKIKGLPCHFKLANFNDLPLPFADDSFDAVYEIQAITYVRNLLLFFKEVHRILKTGGKFAIQDWTRLPNYDEKNPHHLNLMKQIKPVTGAIGTYSVDEYIDLLKKAGFKIVISENPNLGGFQAPIIEKADRFYTRVGKVIRFFVKWKLLPVHFQLMFDRMTKGGEALVEADLLGLVSTCYYIVAQKK